MNDTPKCPRCDAATLKTWAQLTADEKEVVKRLPATTAASLEERKRHQWCTRCWFESTSDEPRNA